MLVVDAANVVGSRPDGWWRDRAGAASRLLDALTRHHDRLGGHDEVVVVLEGAARAAADHGTPAEVRVVRAPGSGDDRIVHLVAAAAGDERSAPVIVVTADRGLRDRVQALGAQTRGPGWLWERIAEADRT